MKTRVSVQRKNGFVYLRIFAGVDHDLQEIGKIFAGTQTAIPDMTRKQLLKKVAAKGPFIHSPGSNFVTIPATSAEVITAARHIL